MKKLISILVLSVYITLVPACNDDKKAANDDKELPAGTVPASVTSAFSAKYAGASDVKWEDAHENDQQTYKAKFMMDGKKWKAEFDANGALVKEGEDN